MYKQTKKTFIAALAALLMFGCAKTEKKGCINKEAYNYCSTCTADDGSCQYSGSLVFWYGEAAVKSLQKDGIKTGNVYIDNQLIGSVSFSIYYKSTPDCTTSGTVNVKKTWKGTPEKSYSYKIVSDTGETIYEGTINFKVGVCLAFELTA